MTLLIKFHEKRFSSDVGYNKASPIGILMLRSAVINIEFYKIVSWSYYHFSFLQFVNLIVKYFVTHLVTTCITNFLPSM